MEANWILTAAGICQVATTFISLLAYVPQWVKLFRTKSSANISLRSWCLWVVSTSFTLFYAVVQLRVNGSGLPLVISASAALTFVFFTVVLIIKFRPREETSREQA